MNELTNTRGMIRPNELGGVSVVCPVHGWLMTGPDREVAENVARSHQNCRRAEGDPS